MADEKIVRRPHPLLVGLAVVGVLTLAAVGSVLAVVGVAISKAPQFLPGRMGGPAKAGKGEYLRGLGPTERAVAGIRLEGEINTPLADDVLEKLQEAEKDDRVVAVLLEVESPGGSVVPSQEMYDAIKRVKAKKPVVSYVRDVAASGAYYTIASSSSIVANRGSMVGSIGVVLQSFHAEKLIEWAKVEPVTLKTGKLKDAGNPARAWTEEDKAYLQALIESTRGQFVVDVKEGRGLSTAAVERMSDGRVVLGPEALELNLIDKLGDRETALDVVGELAKVDPVPEIYYMEASPTNVPIFVRYLFDEGAASLSQAAVRAVREGVREGVKSSLREGPERR